MMGLKTLTTAIAITLAAAACGGSSPVSPTGTDGTGPRTSGGGSTAVITGIVQGGTSGLVSASAGQAITGLTVSVVGTAISSGLDATGRFSLAGVPAGDVQLRFAGSGIDTTVSVTSVQPSQSISLVVAVTVTTVSIETDSRTGAGGEDQVEARIESLPPTTAAGTFVAGGRTVKTDTATRFEQGGATRAFGDLAIGMRVHVKGNASGGTLLASLVQIQNTNTAIPVEINGVIDTFTGTTAAFQFKVGSRLVKGDAVTEFFGGSTFSMLKDGVRVEVKGQQRDGYVYATRIHVDSVGDDDADDGQDSSASIQGTLTARSGSGSTFTLTVGGTTVLTSGATEVKRRGDVQTLDALALGQTLHVVGTRQADKSILARKIEIVDDAPGGEFEIEGSIGGLSGTCPAISFGINGFSIRTSALTEFDGSGCTALKSGTKVQVKGTRAADGVVTATRIRTT